MVFKFFSHTNINQTLKLISLECSRPEIESIYIEFDKLRYVRLKSCIVLIVNAIFWKRDNLGIFLSLSYIQKLKLIYKILFTRKFIFSSDAEVIHIRNNISVFYLQSGIRVKSFIKEGLRKKNDLLNEWNIRTSISSKNIELKIPSLIKLVNNKSITCYMDEIVLGERVNWNDKKSDQVTSLLIDTMIYFYIENGIQWRPFSEVHPTTAKKIMLLIESNNNSDLPSENIINKKIICSSIHGDLSVGNVIVSDEHLYVIDWELSMFGSIIGDLYKIMKKKPVFTKKIEEFFLYERRKIHKVDLLDCATFSEHMFLESFTEKQIKRFAGSQQYFSSKESPTL